MEADPQLVEFLRANLPSQGEAPLRKQLLEDGFSEKEITEALLLLEQDAQNARNKPLRYAAYGGALCLLLALVISVRKPPPPSAPEGPPDAPAEFLVQDSIFHGHYGYIFKLPPGYAAEGSFTDAGKTREAVHIFPRGTDRTHFIHEGLYGQLGILRLEVSPRRVPQGMIGLEALRAWVVRNLAAEKAVYTVRTTVVHEMPAFVSVVTEPFSSARAYVIGQKVYYTLVGGSENALFNDLLSSLIEVDPHDRPGR